MSQRDIETLRAAYEALSRGDRDGIFEIAHPDLEFKSADRDEPRDVPGCSAVVENRIGHLWTMRDGKALRFQIFPEREKVLEAIGMSEQEARAEST